MSSARHSVCVLLVRWLIRASWTDTCAPRRTQSSAHLALRAGQTRAVRQGALAPSVCTSTLPSEDEDHPPLLCPSRVSANAKYPNKRRTITPRPLAPSSTQAAPNKPSSSNACLVHMACEARCNRRIKMAASDPDSDDPAVMAGRRPCKRNAHLENVQRRWVRRQRLGHCLAASGEVVHLSRL